MKELRSNGRVIAACTTIEGWNAAARLLLNDGDESVCVSFIRRGADVVLRIDDDALNDEAHTATELTMSWKKAELMHQALGQVLQSGRGKMVKVAR